MTVHVPDRFKAANAFWIGLAKIGLTPAAVLSHLLRVSSFAW